MTQAEQEKLNREYCKSRGLCVRCKGKAYAVPGKTACQACLDKQAAQERARKQQRRDAGVCPRCGGEMQDGKCPRCFGDWDKYKDSINAKRREEYARRRLLGICTRCGERKAMDGKPRCLQCYKKYERERDVEAARERDRKYNEGRRQYRREHGLCMICGKKKDDSSKCYCTHCRNLCVDRNRKYRILARMDKEAEEARRRTREYKNSLRTGGAS